MAISDRNIRNVAIYAVPRAVGFLTTIVTLPVLTRILTPEDLGIYALAMALPTVAVALLMMSAASASQREYFELREQPERLAAMRASVQMYMLAVLAISAPLVWVARAPIARLALGEPDYGGVMFAAFLAALFNESANFYLLQFQNEERAGTQAAIALLQSASGSGLSVLYAWVFRLGVLSIPAGYATAALLATLVGAVTFNRTRWGRFDAAVLRRVLGYGIQSSPRSFVGFINRFFDKYMISGVASAGAVGVYSVGQTVGSGLNQLMVTLWSAFQPAYYRDVFDGGDESSEAVGRTFTLFAYASCAPLALAALFAGEILWVLAPPSYAAAADVIAIVAAANVTQTFGMYAGVQFAYARKPILLLPIAVLSALITVGANLVLVPVFGLIGAALSLAIMYLVVNATITVVGQRLYRIGYEWRYLVPLFASVAAASVASILLRLWATPSAVSLAVKALVLAVYVLVGVFARILRRDTIARVVRVFSSGPGGDGAADPGPLP